jgi:ribokinase
MDTQDPMKGKFRYSGLIGVGGIGSGKFFALEGNTTLGREESRLGRFLDRRDYCKLHIIAHTAKQLLGPFFPAILVGRVGQDDIGTRLIEEMAAAGLDIRHVEPVAGCSTLFSLCFIYPDGSGGNMTTADSAAARVDAAFVLQAAPAFQALLGNGMVLAAPEAPMEARAQLLAMGTQYGFFRVASFNSQEVASPEARQMLKQVDLLAINQDEAASLTGLRPGTALPQEIVEAAIKKLSLEYPPMWLSITAGKSGSWSWNGAMLQFCPSFHVEAVSTAGAGDAHLAGLIAGIAAGLALEEAQELATLTAAMAVTSPHTIHPELNRTSLNDFANQIHATLSPCVWRFLEAAP